MSILMTEQEAVARWAASKPNGAHSHAAVPRMWWYLQDMADVAKLRREFANNGPVAFPALVQASAELAQRWKIPRAGVEDGKRAACMPDPNLSALPGAR